VYLLSKQGARAIIFKAKTTTAMPTRKPSLFKQIVAPLRRGWAWTSPIFRTRQFWLGLLLGVAGLAALYVAFNNVLMPVYTRQTAEVTVPEVREMTYEDAARVVEGRRLRVERRDQPFNPSLARNVVLDQNPSPNAGVKPGRRVYLYVNSGAERTVVMPEIRTLTESIARAELTELSIVHVVVHIDERPSPYPGTVTRQHPEAGVSLRTSESVQLWVSPGLGDRTVEIPDVRGLAQREAIAELQSVGLWVDPTRVISGTITRQEPSAGGIARVGTEVRLSSVPIDDEPVVDPRDQGFEEYEEGIPPFIEVPPGEELPDLDERPRDPDRIDW
jgi:beta-lactam-binding protein with PASTA domain